MLIKMSDGDWLNPAEVASIIAVEGSGNETPLVRVTLKNGMAFRMAAPGTAGGDLRKLADEIAEHVNNGLKPPPSPYDDALRAAVQESRSLREQCNRLLAESAHDVGRI